MGKATVKGPGGLFLKLINLTVVICILSLITPCFRRGKLVPVETGIARTKSDSPATLLNSAVTTRTGTPSGSPLDESGKKAESEPHRPENTTNKQSANSESNTEQLNEWEGIQMRVTAYCPCPKCCGQYSDGVTACGYRIQPGDTLVAADRRYPFGTEILIPGYSNGQPVKVLDRGGAIKGNRLDVFFDSHSEALEWGVKYLDVKVRRK